MKKMETHNLLVLQQRRVCRSKARYQRVLDGQREDMFDDACVNNKKVFGSPSLRGMSI